MQHLSLQLDTKTKKVLVFGLIEITVCLAVHFSVETPGNMSYLPDISSVQSIKAANSAILELAQYNYIAIG